MEPFLSGKAEPFEVLRRGFVGEANTSTLLGTQ
jgi:hypothetical protein